MISIIICSRKPSLSNALCQNIEQTIGETYETVCVDSTARGLSIYEAYNQGVQQAKGEYLVFMHDDIVFRTQNWGRIISQSLEDKKTGIVGVLGGHIIDETSYSWTSSGYYSGQVIQIMHGQQTVYNHNEDGLGSKVVALDGMLLAIRKELFDKQILNWDDKTYKGFHFYDLDICMQAISHGYNVQVDPVLIEHHSTGAFNLTFYDNCKLFHQKWDSRLPIHSPAITPAMQKIAYQTATNKICAQGKAIAIHNQLMNRTPYKLITKLLLLCGIDPYKTHG